MSHHQSSLLDKTIKQVKDYLEHQHTMPVIPEKAHYTISGSLDFDLPTAPTSPEQVMDLLHEVGSPGTVTSSGGRYYGFVIGGTLPVALAAHCLSGAWDQCAGLHVLSPVGEKLEIVAGRWLKELLGLPQQSGTGFVTGATMGNFTGLATARHSILKDLGWNVEAQGLYGAPEIQVVVGEEVHVSILKSLALLGFGSERVVRIPVDDQGRIKVEEFNFEGKPTIVCLQAGNVDSGSCDYFEELIPKAKANNAWGTCRWCFRFVGSSIR